MARLFCDKQLKLCRTTACGECGLYRSSPNPKLAASGSGEARVLVVCGRPTKRDSQEGVNMFGAAGTQLREILSEHGLDLERDCRLMHITGCHASKEDKDHALAPARCYPRVAREVMVSKPKVILLAGQTAARAVISRRFPDFGEFSRWTGYAIPDKEFDAWLCPITDMRVMAMAGKDASGGGKGKNWYETLRVTTRLDISNALSKLDAHVSVPDYASRVKALPVGDAVKWLEAAMAVMDNEAFPLIAFDYEATGLKPYNKAHSIRCVSFCRSPDETVAFMWDKEVIPVVKRLLENPHYRKVGANIKYEDTWSRVKAGIAVRGWEFDTVNAAHLLDNRRGVSGVKFQTYARLGVPDYSQGVKRQLDADSPNDVNDVYTIPAGELLRYCGLDSLFEYIIAGQMMDEMKRKRD